MAKRPPAGPPAAEHPVLISDYPEHRTKLALLRLVRVVSALPVPRRLADALMRRLQLDPSTVRASVRTILDNGKTIVDLIEMPDRFNRALGSHGWLAYESLNADIMQSAVEAAEQGRVADAERVLLGHFQEETLRYGLGRIASLRCFRMRADLARLAVEDHIAGRFHASVLVVLSLLDGMVADLSPSNKGFFNKEPDLTAWESVAGHPSGLLRAARMFTQPNGTTRNQPLDYPWRHGIVHGRDLGYANETVSAKCWATLFAAGDWARKVERGEHLRPPERPLQQSLRELSESARSLRELRDNVEAWRPRTVIVPDEPDVSPEAFQKDTPEHVLVQFLHAWLLLRRSDSTAPGRYGLMATHVFPRHVSSAISLRAREMASLLEGLQLDGFRLIRAIDAAPALACVDVECTFVSKLVLVGYRLLFADANGEVLPRGSACGRWYVVNWGEPALMVPVVPSDLG